MLVVKATQAGIETHLAMERMRRNLCKVNQNYLSVCSVPKNEDTVLNRFLPSSGLF